MCVCVYIYTYDFDEILGTSPLRQPRHRLNNDCGSLQHEVDELRVPWSILEKGAGI